MAAGGCDEVDGVEEVGRRCNESQGVTASWGAKCKLLCDEQRAPFGCAVTRPRGTPRARAAAACRRTQVEAHEVRQLSWLSCSDPDGIESMSQAAGLWVKHGATLGRNEVASLVAAWGSWLGYDISTSAAQKAVDFLKRDILPPLAPGAQVMSALRVPGLRQGCFVGM